MFFSQPSLLFSIPVWLISIRALVFSLSVRLSTAGELEVGEERGLLPWNLHLEWYQVHSGSSIQQQQLQNVQELTILFFIRVCGNFSQRVKCKADQISHFCLLVDIKERPRMCKKKSEKRKQSVKQRGGARRNTKTQTQKSRKAKSQEHSCKMS